MKEILRSITKCKAIHATKNTLKSEENFDSLANKLNQKLSMLKTCFKFQLIQIQLFSIKENINERNCNHWLGNEIETSKCKYQAPRKIVDMISYTTSRQTYILTLNNSTFYKSSKYKYSFINTNVFSAFLAF